MIAPQTLCYIVGNPTSNAEIPRLVEIVSVPGTPNKWQVAPVCDVRSVREPQRLFSVSEWRWLRPITPPAPDAQALRDRELAA